MVFPALAVVGSPSARRRAQRRFVTPLRSLADHPTLATASVALVRVRSDGRVAWSAPGPRLSRLGRGIRSRGFLRWRRRPPSS
jgi:hypothetical protein